MKKLTYIEPEFKVVIQNTEDVLTASGGEDFNMAGDQPHKLFIKNTNWTIEF